MTEENAKNNDDTEKDLQTLAFRRSMLNDRRMKSSDYFDKYMLSFSTGALYLSVISLNGKQDIGFKYMIAIGWALLIVAIIATVISFIISEKAFEQQMNIVDEKTKALLSGKEIKIMGMDFYAGILDSVKIISAFSFIAGIILLAIFYFLNI
jgi:hypothetical protein